IAVDFFLVAQRGHPGAAAFGRAPEIVAKEKPAVAALRVTHFPRLDVRVPGYDVRALLEGKAEQPIGRIEGAFDDMAELEIGLDGRLVDVALPLAQFFGV